MSDLSVIEFRNVSKVFKSRKSDVYAVKNVSLSINEGDIYGIIGYSGAGKSTLVRLINQLEDVSSGELQVLDKKVGHLNESELKKLRSNVGMIFQSFNLFKSKNVLKNVEFPLKVLGIPKVQRKERVLELLDFVGLQDKANAFPGQLSGGQKQRVGIARALATNPRVLLADEATSALDPETTLDVLRLLKRVNSELGVTIMVITHTMSVARMICNKVAVMSDGEVVEFGDTQSIFNNPQSEIGKRFINVFNVMEKGDLGAVSELLGDELHVE